MGKKIKEWISILIAKNPGMVVLIAILLFNIIFFVFAALLISNFALSGTEKMNFFEAAFCTITMILDAGCIQFVIEDIGEANVFVSLLCFAIIFIGMISFTGAVIGYITNYISSFIENANEGANKLNLSGHIVILNWNTRASEIVNDLIYCDTPQKVVVLTASNKSEIEKIIDERLNDTVERENKALRERLSTLSMGARHASYRKNKLRNNMTVIVREGDVFSSKQLHDISIEHAKTVIILGKDIISANGDINEDSKRGNSQTIKTLMQVADITSSQYSDDDQKIIVEITDEWTWDVVDKIIKCKQVDSKCNIVPVRVNKILGQILSQFSLMPELNLTYTELFSNKGAAFFTRRCEESDDNKIITRYLNSNLHAIPLTIMTGDKHNHFYYAAGSENDIDKNSTIPSSDFKVKLNHNYTFEKKNIIILGHNSKCIDIMEGFKSFTDEWDYKNSDEQILQIVVIDDENTLKKMNNYVEYPFVVETVAASIYDREIITNAIDSFMKKNNEDISILILSDDSAPSEDIDANTLASLVFVQDIINNRIAQNPDFDPEYIDVIAEITDPKHHDIVNSYSTNNVVISNRYISKMITQIGEKEALFDFYSDILTYDSPADDNQEAFESKEIYAKKVSRFFDEIPGECRADEFIRSVYNASIDPSIPASKRNPTIVLGYVKPGGKMVIFNGNQSDIKVKLDKKDKLIVFSNH